MAAITVPAPGAVNHRGDEIGPCTTQCSHEYCADLIKYANQACDNCGERIGYDRRYFRDPQDDDPAQDQFIHEVCA